MSRLHSVRAPLESIAAHFGAEPSAGLVVPGEVIEGLPGVVVIERDWHRFLRAMAWGFPRLTSEMRERDDPPGRIGLVADLTNPMWERLVADPRYRCLIVLSHFANPAGEPGAKTRTWFSQAGQPIAAWAGFCRNLPDEGPVYAGMTMTANAAVMPTNDRMPVLLAPHDYDRWLKGSIKDVIDFQFRPPIAAGRLMVQPTADLWRSGKPPPQEQPTLL